MTNCLLLLLLGALTMMMMMMGEWDWNYHWNVLMQLAVEWKEEILWHYRWLNNFLEKTKKDFSLDFDRFFFFLRERFKFKRARFPFNHTSAVWESASFNSSNGLICSACWACNVMSYSFKQNRCFLCLTNKEVEGRNTTFPAIENSIARP